MAIAALEFPIVGMTAFFLSSWAAIFLLLLAYIAYNAWFHPLSRFPGPTWAAIFPIWIMRAWLSGHYVHSIKDLHDKYGPVVRTSPNQLSFCSATSWKDIYGHVPGRKTFLKGTFYEPMPGQMRTLVSVSDVNHHAVMRKTLSHGFSASALTAQEDLVHGYADMLIRQIHNCNGAVGNVVKWYNFTTFDIIGELAFGESFGSLEAGKSHYWIDTFLASAKALTFLRAFEYFPPIRTLFRTLYKAKLLPQKITTPGRNQSQYGRDKVEKYSNPSIFYAFMSQLCSAQATNLSCRRLRTNPPRTDFLTKMITERDKNETSLQELTAQAGMLVRAGSETTATAMSGITYFLGRNPRVYNKLAQEIREKFSSYDQISAKSTDSLPYLKAVIEEGLRLYPPIAIGLPRVSPGETVDGCFVPEGAIVYVSSWAATHNENNFHRPFEFIPERWIYPECKDKKTASQPFSLGPRGCLGRNLAQMDLRLILSKILWTFDFKLVDESQDWIAENKCYVTWQKPELKIEFSARPL